MQLGLNFCKLYRNMLSRLLLFRIKLEVTPVTVKLGATLLFVYSCYSAFLEPDLQPSAGSLMRDVVAIELADRTEHSKWIYRVTRVVGGQTFTEVEVETKDGPVHRLLAINDTPLDTAQRQKETRRSEELLRNPSLQRAIKKQYDADQLRLEDLMRLLPNAFQFQYDGRDGSNVRLRFHPDPAFVPPTMDSKALRSMAGTILIDPQQKRLVHMSGLLEETVDVGFGVLGRLDKGGTVEIERIQVSSSHWKTNLLDIHLSGRVLFKTISKQQHETRSEFESVSKDLDLWQAEKLLGSRPDLQRAHCARRLGTVDSLAGSEPRSMSGDIQPKFDERAARHPPSPKFTVFPSLSPSTRPHYFVTLR